MNQKQKAQSDLNKVKDTITHQIPLKRNDRKDSNASNGSGNLGYKVDNQNNSKTMFDQDYSVAETNSDYNWLNEPPSKKKQSDLKHQKAPPSKLHG